MQLYGHAPDLAEHLPIPNAYDRIRDWIRSGKLQPHTDPAGQIIVWDGRPVYAMADVYRVELATRQAGKRARNLTRWADFAQSMP